MQKSGFSRELNACQETDKINIFQLPKKNYDNFFPTTNKNCRDFFYIFHKSAPTLKCTFLIFIKNICDWKSKAEEIKKSIKFQITSLRNKRQNY